MSVTSSDETAAWSMFDHMIRLARLATGATFAAFYLVDELPFEVIDSPEHSGWLTNTESFAIGAPLLITDVHSVTQDQAEPTSQATIAAFEPWVRSFAVAPITGPSAESGYAVLASDELTADASWLDALHHIVEVVQERLDRTVEQRRLDQISAMLRTNQSELNETKIRLELANKELEQFAYIAAHELVAPLRAVAIYAEVLEDLAATANDDIGQTAQACAVSIRDGVALMNQQVQYLLELSQGRADPADIEAIDLHDVVNLALDTLAPTLDEADAVVNIGDLAVIHGKAIPLQSVFANLLSNAVRYREPSRELVLDIRAENDDEHVVISVTDTGTGVEDADRQRIFQLFERASVDPAGAGIGLGLSRRIVESFGGEMGVNSAEPVGSTFWMRFPRLSS